MIVWKVRFLISFKHQCRFGTTYENIRLRMISSSEFIESGFYLKQVTLNIRW